jgi:hypothetical protein
MFILWPSFFMAGVTLAQVFAVVDPSDLSWFGAAPMDLPRGAIYTLSFLIFWLLISLASAMSLLLATLPDGPDKPHPRHWPR